MYKRQELYRPNKAAAVMTAAVKIMAPRIFVSRSMGHTSFSLRRNAVKSVSYTHLDVYKRQVSRRGRTACSSQLTFYRIAKERLKAKEELQKDSPLIPIHSAEESAGT